MCNESLIDNIPQYYGLVISKPYDKQGLIVGYVLSKSVVPYLYSVGTVGGSDSGGCILSLWPNNIRK